MRNILLILLYIGFCSSYNFAQITAIPDTAFEQRLIQLNIDSDGTVNGQMATIDGQFVSHLNLATSGPTIHDLTGIEAFTDLVSLNCAFNELTSLTLATHPNLTTLSCHENNLAQLDLGNVSSLLQINCSGNNLDSLYLGNNLGLTYLNCIDNNFSQLDVRSNVNLVSFYISENQFMNIDISQNTALNSFICNDNLFQHLDVSNNTALTQFFCRNNQLSALDLRSINNLNSFDARQNLPYLQICVLNTVAAYTAPAWNKDLPAVYVDICNSSTVSGRIAIDGNNNCLADSTETGLPNQLIKFERISDGFTRINSSYDNQGNYQTYLDTGVYNISVIPSNAYWQPCLPTQQLTIVPSFPDHNLDATLQSVVSCPLLEVDIAAPFLRRTGGGSNYTVSYCNTGTVAVPNPMVNVTLDPDLIYLGASIPLASQSGAVYSFNLPSLGVGDCGSFSISVLVDSTAIINQTHCSEAHIFPDSLCAPGWNGPLVEGNASCQNDTVLFYLENTGTAMNLPQDYTIIEDDIAMRSGSIQLGAGQSTTIRVAAKESSTYRILVNQASGLPLPYGHPIFSTAIEGCIPDGSGNFHTSFFTMFENDDASPFVAVDCQNNIAAIDPNDKQAQPVGYSNNHYIYPQDLLNYKIRFQNTGTDTAFNVLVTDTLSPYLDYTQIKMGSSSHDYFWLLEEGNILKVYFPDIKLVDSTTNEPLSHGYFNFQIHQTAQNPIGTVINNSAAIYFDFNAAVITNMTTHTIGEDFIVVAVEQVLFPETEVTVAPNPFSQTTTISVTGEEYEELSIQIFDVSGRLLKQQSQSATNSIQLSRDQLNSGLYFYRLMGNHQLISTGKIVVK